MGGFPLSEVKRSQARQMRRDGRTVRAIASTLGIPRATVHDAVRDVRTVLVRYCALCDAAFTIGVPTEKRTRLYCCNAHATKARGFRVLSRGRAA